jgi:hypothetical protein
MKVRVTALIAMILLSFICMPNGLAADKDTPDPPYKPHTPTLIFYLSGADAKKDADAIRIFVGKLKSATTQDVNATRSYARIRFDSHIVSYHQVAQAIIDAGKSLGKTYDPYLVFSVPAYSLADNAAKVDAIFAGKRLNSRVHIKSIDKTKGLFSIHFLPLEADADQTAPQGFNGGHLHHPISDPPPHGLGLPSTYAATDILGS